MASIVRTSPKLILALKRIEGTTACLLHSCNWHIPMNGSKSCGSKYFPLFFYMLTILVLPVIYIGKCPKIIYPGKEAFRILSDHFWEHVLLEKNLTTNVIRPFVNTKGLSPSQNFSDSDKTHPIAKGSVKCLVLCANICSQHISEYHVLQMRPTTR